MHDLNKRFITLVLKLQEINATQFSADLTEKQKLQINRIGAEIKEKGLLDKCESRHFAKQLMMKNNVPDKYWK